MRNEPGQELLIDGWYKEILEKELPGNSVLFHKRRSYLKRYVIRQLMAKQAHDLQFIQCIKDGVVGFLITLVAG